MPCYFDSLTCIFHLFPRVETLVRACNSCHANSCLSCTCACLHIFVFFNCALSQVFLLCQRTQMHALAVRTHTRVRASACRRVCVHFFSPESLLLLFIYAGYPSYAFGIQRSQAAVHPGCCSPGRKIGLPAVAGSTPQFSAFATSSRT